MTKLEPGTYKLSRDVVNPSPDKRCRHDWRKLALWTKDMTFRVRNDPAMSKDGTSDFFEMWNGRYSHISFGNWRNMEQGWELIAPHLVRVDENPSQWMLREHGEHSGAPWGIMDMLVAEGRLTLDDIKELTQRYYDSLED